MAVVVEHGGSGSGTAAPIARDILAKALELDPSRPRPALSAAPGRSDPA
jgi:penicillin-binding protein 2